jgi:hypothetical protein
VGYCEDGVGNDHPILWAQGQVIALPFPSGTESAVPAAINDESQIAGTAIPPRRRYLARQAGAQAARTRAA